MRDDIAYGTIVPTGDDTAVLIVFFTELFEVKCKRGLE